MMKRRSVKRLHRSTQTLRDPNFNLQNQEAKPTHNLVTQDDRFTQRNSRELSNYKIQPPIHTYLDLLDPEFNQFLVQKKIES